MQHIKANGVDLAYVENGSGEPVILLHGANSDRTQYDIFRPLLGEGIRAIAYDQRDAPDSPWQGGDYEIADHADDLAAFIIGLGLSSAHIVGVSYGGAVAMTLALRHPAQVKSLVLAATIPSYDMLVLPDPSLARDLGSEGFQRFMLERGISPEAVDNDPQLVAEARATMVQRSPESSARRIGALSRFDARGELHAITAPTLVLVGDLDPIAPPGAGRFIAAQIPGARLTVLEDSRHGVTIEHRQRTADHIRAFVLAQTVGQ